MPRFRSRSTLANSEPVTADAIGKLAEVVLSPGQFFLSPGFDLKLRHESAENLAWEIFQGRLLDPAHTRESQTFRSWNLFLKEGETWSGEPLLSIKLDGDCRRLFVVRGLECHVHEGYDSGGGVFLTREKQKWVRELTGTIVVEQFDDLGDLHDELVSQVFHAVVGASRLPLHSVEAPLPGVSFGDLLYVYQERADSKPMRNWPALLERAPTKSWNQLEQARCLETILHALETGDLTEFARRSSHCLEDTVGTLRVLFNTVSLSPWTNLVEQTIAFLGALEESGRISTEGRADFLGHLLRQTCRHLTAYDLVTFHYRGANYPDALLLDAVLQEYLGLAERHSQLFLGDSGDTAAKRLRRRALRQAWLLRSQYEGLSVPDLPTSPGENNRVLPASHPRVPDEQLLQTKSRWRKLYDGRPLPKEPDGKVGAILRQSVADLTYPAELRELGIGLFIERPFGDGKAPAEPDQTLLLASVGFSAAVAGQRLRTLSRGLGFLDIQDADGLVDGLTREPVRGVPLSAIGAPSRMGAMGLANARQVSTDFVFLHTVRTGVAEFLEQFDVGPLAASGDLAWLTSGRNVLVARSADFPGVRVYDEHHRPRLELLADVAEGFRTRAGREFPVRGLKGRWVVPGENETWVASRAVRLAARLP